MEKLVDKLEEFKAEISQRIKFLLQTKGIESQFSTDKVLQITDEEQMLNLEDGRYLVEISENCLIDNCGYRYSHDIIGLE